MQMTLEELTPEICQKQKCTASDFHARLSVLLESEMCIRDSHSIIRSTSEPNILSWVSSVIETTSTPHSRFKRDLYLSLIHI